MTLRLSDLDRDVPLETVWKALEGLRDEVLALETYPHWCDDDDCMEDAEVAVSQDDVLDAVQGVIDEIVSDW